MADSNEGVTDELFIAIKESAGAFKALSKTECAVIPRRQRWLHAPDGTAQRPPTLRHLQAISMAEYRKPNPEQPIEQRTIRASEQRPRQLEYPHPTLRPHSVYGA